jgi:GNAT superfamily N-acetyltransferase
MSQQVEIINFDPVNITQHGFFCFKSKKKAEGYQRKMAWLRARFAEGMQMKMVVEDGRSVGFIEYIPGEYGWRAVHAPGYMLIHCLWVVGTGKGKGYGARLIDLCLEDARQQGLAGVAMVSSSRVWLADKEIFLRQGFTAVDAAPPSFDLLVHKFNGAPNPAFPTDWAARQAQWGDGLTIFRTDQCPYIEDAARQVVTAAQERGITARSVELTSSQAVQAQSPTAYGVFGIVYNGRLLAYHYLLPKDLDKLLGQASETAPDA